MSIPILYVKAMHQYSALFWKLLQSVEKLLFPKCQPSRNLKEKKAQLFDILNLFLAFFSARFIL